MARQLADHGTRHRYNQGCTDGPDGEACVPCRQANNEYSKQNSQVKRAEALGAENVTSITKGKRTTKRKTGNEDDDKPAPREPGPMEVACLAVTANLDRAKARPDLVEAALALARDIDLPLAIAQRNNLVARYQAVLDDLTKGSEKKSRLTAVRQMTKPASATG